MRHLRAFLLAASVSLLTGCDRLPPDCRIGVADSGQMSTRTLFLERLNGCPVGGRG